jgi:hypothetical protein
MRLAYACLCALVLVSLSTRAEANKTLLDKAMALARLHTGTAHNPRAPVTITVRGDDGNVTMFSITDRHGTPHVMATIVITDTLLVGGKKEAFSFQFRRVISLEDTGATGRVSWHQVSPLPKEVQQKLGAVHAQIDIQLEYELFLRELIEYLTPKLA